MKNNSVQTRQLSLIAFLSKKDVQVSPWQKINYLRQELKADLGNDFTPYALDKIHGTIVGLEGFRKNGNVIGMNFYSLRNMIRPLELEHLLKYLKDSTYLPTQIKIGGYPPTFNRFLSQGKLPYERSFCIHNDKVVLIGWPDDERGNSNRLHKLRKKCEEFGALHKYFRDPDSFDNDFYLVIGTLKKPLDEKIREELHAKYRRQMESWKSTFLNINLATLGIVAYKDIQLLEASYYPIDEAILNMSDLENRLPPLPS